jgi:hypothetical protein
MDEAPASSLARAWATLRKRFRVWLRACHRDIGYLAVGLTFVYALSGLAINHIGEFDPNFKETVATHTLPAPLPADDKAAERMVRDALGIQSEPRDVFIEATTIEMQFDRRTILVDRKSGQVTDKREQPRFFLRVANWLHYNRGKAAWTYIADGYAVFLLFLAISGPLLLKGKKGLWGRGAILILLGSLAPILYVHFSGGPK